MRYIEGDSRLVVVGIQRPKMYVGVRINCPPDCTGKNPKEKLATCRLASVPQLDITPSHIRPSQLSKGVCFGNRSDQILDRIGS